MIPYSRLNALIYIPYPRVNCLKTTPFTAAHTYIAHTWHPPPPPQGRALLKPRTAPHTISDGNFLPALSHG